MIRIENKKNYDGSGVYIGRAIPRLGLAKSLLANEYRIGKDGIRKVCKDKYKIWFQWRLESDPSFENYIKALAKIDLEDELILICWCSPYPCHGEDIRDFIQHYNETGRWSDTLMI